MVLFHLKPIFRSKAYFANHHDLGAGKVLLAGSGGVSSCLRKICLVGKVPKLMNCGQKDQSVHLDQLPDAVMVA